MENKSSDLLVQGDEVTINLKELLLYVCRKWRILLVLGVAGLIAGALFGVWKSNVSPESFDPDKLNLMEIEQYARYSELYDKQMEYEQESVLLSIDPKQAYEGSVRYYLKVQAANSMVVEQQYKTILLENSIYQELIEASGLDCTLRAMQELVSVSVQELDRQEQLMAYEDYPLTVAVTAQVTAPTAESCQSMLDILDGHVQEVNRWTEASYGVQLLERTVDPCELSSYHTGIVNSKNTSTAKLVEYSTELNDLKEALTDDDLTYYTLVYEADEYEPATASSGLKWALVFGLLFGALGVLWYCIRFVTDGHLKSIDELLTYGLYPVALLKGKNGEAKRNAIDRLFMAKHSYHTDAYLVDAIRALGMDRVLLSGDLGDEDIRLLSERVEKMTDIAAFSMRMSADAHTQLQDREAQGVLLIVHLWRTTRDELEQELRICRKIGVNLVGVVALD